MKIAALLLLAAAAAPAFAQGEAQCILAGRVSEGQWAPRFDAVQLRDAQGRTFAPADRASLRRVKSVELEEPALLSRCNGDQRLASGGATPPGPKKPVPALSPGVAEVQAVHFPRLRNGAELVELQVRVPADRVVAITR
jgi:hypothetical protein